MERKRIEKLVALLLVGILIPVSLFPFRINADTIDSHIIGRNISYEFIQGDQYNGYAVNQSVFHVEIVLDGDYIGFMQPNFTLEYYNYFYGANPPTWNTISISFTNRIFVNGNKVKFDIPLKWNSLAIGQSSAGTSPYFYDSYTITSSNVTAYGVIDSLSQIIDILNENQDIISDIYSELQNVVSNTSLANDYLEIISQCRQWNIPFESINYIYPFFTYENRRVIDLYNNGYNMIFPIIELKQNQTIINHFHKNYYSPAVCLFYFYTDSNGTFGRNNITTYNVSSYDFEIISSILVSGGYMYLVKLSNIVISSGYARFVYTGSYDTKFIPIYMNNMNNKSISTDFALKYGLTNQLLDDLHIIAQGTSQSSSASGSLDQATSQFSDDANDLVTIEESFNNSMNQSLQNVNPTFNMGSSFLASANWVSQQFNRIVNDTPFASLITFGLTLGLGLLIIGKVRK